jgi:hypothetical protein
MSQSNDVKDLVNLANAIAGTVQVQVNIVKLAKEIKGS